jgi:hypothetical protein
MGISRYTLYKYVKVDGTWRYCKAAYHDNGKIKPDIVFVNVKEELLEKRPQGRYYMSHNGGWIDAGTDALDAQRKRKQRLALDEFHRLSGKASAQSSALLPDSSGGSTVAAAAENTLLTAKLVASIPRPSASIGLPLIRSSHIAAPRTSTSAGITSRSCSTIWAGCGNSPCRSASTATPSALSPTGLGTCAFS